MNKIQLEVKEVIKKNEVEVWRMQSLDVALALEFKAKDKTAEIKSEFEIEENLNLWKYEIWKLEDEISWMKRPQIKDTRRYWILLRAMERQRNEELWLSTNMLEYNAVRG